MAFILTSDSIIIDAALTEKGRKHLARGTLEISKFAFGDDEIDYGLMEHDTAADGTAGFLKTKMLEAYSDKHKNIQFGLNSFDRGILYLRVDELESPHFNPEYPHAFLLYLPILKQNTVLKETPSLKDSVYYVSANEETTQKITKKIPGFRFIESNNSEKTKFIVETGIDGPECAFSDTPFPIATYKNRKRYIVEKFLLDQDFLIYADSRFVSKMLGTTRNAQFQNFPSGESIVNFEGLQEIPAISLENQFDNYATFTVKTVDNLMSDFGLSIDDASRPTAKLSDLRGAKGVVSAFNIKVAPELKVNSTGTRDFRYSEFGKTDQIVFSELPSDKFDYIDTALYVVGATTSSRIRIPIRIIRYSGT